MEGDIKGFRKKVIVYQISIHALRVEGDGNAEDKRVAQLLISIHALRVEGDFPRPRRSGAACISIHALRVEGDSPAASFRTCPPEFLSTPSGWRATVGLVKRSHDVKISIHALRVEGDEFLFGHGRVVLISIHALRVEGDESSIPSCGRMSKFLSTPSGWRATASWTPYL